MTLLITAFPESNIRHGGVRRSSQLREFAVKNKWNIINPPVGKRNVILSGFKNPFDLILISPIVFLIGLRYLSWRGVFAALFYGAWLRAELRSRNWPLIHLEVAPNANMLIASFLVQYRLPYYSYPHNIEFLVPGQRQNFFRSLAGEFAQEVDVYRKSIFVYAISEFDLAVIGSLGVDSVNLLPYSPSASDAIFLDEIKKFRQKRLTKSGFMLILGSVANSPTRIGIEKLLNEIRLSNNSGMEFKLVGYGTEVLIDSASSNVTVLGGVSNQDLRKLFIECDGIIIFQPQTSGFLTKLTEAVIADIPIYVFDGYIQAKLLNNVNVKIIKNLNDLINEEY